MSDPVKVALIGHGHLGKWHAEKVIDSKNAELIAIVESNEAVWPELSSKYPETRLVHSLDEVKESIDAALVVTPTSTHFKLVQNLLASGKHVFCEKPLCSTYDEALEIEELLSAHRSLVLQVGHSERFHKAWEIVKKYEQFLTAPCNVQMNRVASFKGRATDVDVVQDLMIHDLDLLVYLFREIPQKVTSQGFKMRTKHWDHVVSWLEFPSGRKASITASRNYTGEERSVVFSNVYGTLEVDLLNCQINVARAEEERSGHFVEKLSYEKRDHLKLEQEAFYSSIKNGTTPPVMCHDGVVAVMLVEKLRQSLESQKPLTID